jgi:hypothetical protein
VIVGCGEPAGQLIGSDERDGGDRHHEVSILIASCLMVGRWRGTQPAANVSMITMREPQHGQGCGRIHKNFVENRSARHANRRNLTAYGPATARLFPGSKWT